MNLKIIMRQIEDYLNSKKSFSLTSINERTMFAIKKHFKISNDQIIILSWIKGLWTGALISIILHHYINH